MIDRRNFSWARVRSLLYILVSEQMDPKETTKETSASTAEKELSEVKPPSSERESTGSTADPDNVVLERKHSADTDEDDVKTKKRKLKDDQIKDESHGINEEPAGQKKDDKKEKEENLKSIKSIDLWFCFPFRCIDSITSAFLR